MKDDYFLHFHKIRVEHAGAYVIDRSLDGKEYQLIQLQACGDGSDALCFTGELEQCRNQFFERTKRMPNEARNLYVIDETIRFTKEI
jgi:hypothetical protein